MTKQLFIENEIVIDAPISAVWDALTQARYTKHYMYGTETVSDWQVGNPLLWVGHHEGNDVTYVKGIIEELDPLKKLVYSVFDPNNTEIEDTPENYLHVTYQLTRVDGGTLLQVKQGDYSTVAQGQKRFEDSYNNGTGWQPILEQIKTMLETS